MEVSIPMFMYGLGFICGMIFVWAFGISHDIIINYYREAVYARALEKEKKVLAAQNKSENPFKPE